MRIQLLWLMFLFSMDNTFIKVPNRVTRSADKLVFKVPSKITPVYEHSPYYIRTNLWNNYKRQLMFIRLKNKFVAWIKSM